MKAELKHESTEEKTYPYIGEATNHTDFLILFFAPSQGVCLTKGSSACREGEYAENWSEQLFKKFKGEVILSN